MSEGVCKKKHSDLDPIFLTDVSWYFLSFHFVSCLITPGLLPSRHNVLSS